jgi:signal transduction histidine kinase
MCEMGNLEKRSNPLILLLSVALALGIGFIDYKTGQELSLSIFYLFPLFVAAWFLQIRWGIFISLFCALTWFLSDIFAGYTKSHYLLLYWDLIERLMMFIVISVVVSKLKTELMKRGGLISRLRDSLDDLKKSQEALSLKTRELADSNAQLEHFASVAAHDLKHPLLVVSGYLQLLQRRYKGKLDPKADAIIGTAMDKIDLMGALIKDLLDFSRVGTQGKKLVPVDMNDILAQALSNLEKVIAENAAEITTDALPEVTADPIQMVQLLQNLIGNAIKYRREETPKIRVSAERKDAECIFAVSDNGIGIDPKDRDSIFEIFRRLQKTNSPGTGIGLATVKRIVDRHGGRIWVESAPGEGATFYFTIPDGPGQD